jgi:hypothetical protein
LSDSARLRNASVKLVAKEVGVDSMAQSKFEQAKAQLESVLREPVVTSAGVNAAGQALLERDGSDSPFWQPYVTVDGEKHSRVPRAMFLILTPTRLIVTGLRSYKPDLDAPILVLAREDADITATQNERGVWTYCLRSRASGAELEVETRYRDHGAKLAEYLRAFAGTPTAPGLATTTPNDTPALGYNRRTALNRYRRGNTLAGIILLVLSLAGFGVGAYTFYAYHAGTPAKATVVSCSKSRTKGRTCQGTWTINGESHRGRIDGDLDDSRQAGSSIDVHVYKSKAYPTAWVDKWWWIAAAMFGAGAVFMLFVPGLGKRDV